MSPFQNSHQPTHAGQPAGALNFAPDEEPIASSFDGAGPPLDFTFMEAPGFWNHEFASQNAFDSGLNEPWMMPTFNAEGGLFDYTSNYRTDETLGFNTGLASPSVPGPALNGQMMLPLFDPTLCMGQPLGLLDAGAASQGALFAVGQAPIAPGGAQSYLQHASFDGHQADWTNHGADMPDALDPFADNVRARSPAVRPETMFGYHVGTLQQYDHLNTADAPEQHAHAPAISNVGTGSHSSPSNESPVSTPRTRRARKSLQLKCDVESCTHKGTFRRRWELQRHVQTKHPRGIGASFVCRAKGCFNKRMLWTFTRPDKLTSHIRANHNRDDIFTACPVNGCDLGETTLETLGVHLQRVHRRCEERRGVLNASTSKTSKCPLWRCGKNVKAAELLGHVTGHDTDEVLLSASRLGSVGLVATVASEPARIEHSKRGLVVVVKCPICNTTCGDLDGFINHLCASHLFLAGSGGFDHFIDWKSDLARNTAVLWHSQVIGLSPWGILPTYFHPKARVQSIQCSSCLISFHGLGGDWLRPSEVQQAARKAAFAHHLSLLRPEAEVIAELYPHRMQILRLCPEFVSHPVFADFDQPQAGISSSSQEPSQFDGTDFTEGFESHGEAMTDFNTSF